MAAALAVARTFWLQAANSPHGIGVIVTDPARARHQLYKAREQLQETGIDLSNFAIRTSPDMPAAELWLIRTPRTAPHQPAPPSEASLDARSPSIPLPQDGHPFVGE